MFTHAARLSARVLHPRLLVSGIEPNGRSCVRIHNAHTDGPQSPPPVERRNVGALKRRRTGQLAVMMHMEMRDVNVAAARSSNGGAGGGRRRQRWSQSDILSAGVAELGGNSCWRGLGPHFVFV